IANHNWESFAFALYAKVFKKQPSGIIGDARFGFSKKSIRRILSMCGFEILMITGIEKGKIIKELRKSLFYKITFILLYCSLGLVCLTPGLIVIAKKK
ncbi:MAG: hypothetical protein ACTSPI_16690, partial [Candidatus Heimdallarchaeaceae archaeon]